MTELSTNAPRFAARHRTALILLLPQLHLNSLSNSTHKPTLLNSHSTSLQNPYTIAIMSVSEVSLKPFTDQKPGTLVATPLFAPAHRNQANQHQALVYERRSSSFNNLTTVNPSSPASSSPSPKVSRIVSSSLVVMDDTGIQRSYN